MAKITLIIESDDFGTVAEGKGLTAERNINDRGLTRILDAYKHIYVAANELPPTANKKRVARRWFAQFIRGSRESAKKTETEIAVRSARDSITDVED